MGSIMSRLSAHFQKSGYPEDTFWASFGAIPIPKTKSKEKCPPFVHSICCFLHRLSDTKNHTVQRRKWLFHSIHTPYYYYYLYITTTAIEAAEKGWSTMQFKVTASDMNYGMGMAVRALSSHVAKHAYDGVFMETIPEGVQLTCTDGKITIKTLVPAMVEEDGCALIPAKLLYELLRKSEGEMVIHVDTQTLKATVTAMGSKTNIVCMDAVEFPEIADVAGDFVTNLPQKEFASAISKIIFAIASDEVRQILTGCLMEVYREEVRFVCLDGFRLAMQKVYVNHDVPADQECRSAIIPGTIINEVSRMAGDTQDELAITCSNTHMMAVIGKTTVFSPLIAGEYINYKQILPATWTTAVKLDRAALNNAIERAAVIAREGNNLLRLHMDMSGMTISANTERGSAEENVAAEFDGAPLNIAFSARYLQDVLRNVDTQEMAMRFNTNVSPCVVGPVKGNQYTYLILPVRTIE